MNIKSFFLYAKIMMTGGIILGLELASSKIMTPFFGVSIHVWSSILAVTLVALALGYKMGGALTHRLSARYHHLYFVSAGTAAAIWMNITLWSYPFVFRALSDFSLVTGSIAACLFTIFIPLLILSSLNPVLVALLNNKETNDANANNTDDSEKGEGDYGAGTVLFTSTLGSVGGVFIVTYAMMPYLSNFNTIAILALVAALLSLALLIFSARRREKPYKTAIALTLLTLTVTGFTLFSSKISSQESFIHDGKTWTITHSEPSHFSGIKVVDVTILKNLTTRLLITDGLLQNTFLISPHGDMIPYNLYTYALERMALTAYPNAQNALILGLGAGVLPTAFYYKGLNVDVIEIDPKTVEIAERFFKFDPTIIDKITHQDARTAIRQCDKSYDIIALDLFNGDGIPEHLVTREFFSDIANCLSEDGVLVMNSFHDPDNPAAAHALTKTLTSVMGSIFAMNAKETKEGTLLNGFFTARKSGKMENLTISTADLPNKIAYLLAQNIENKKIYEPDSKLLQDAIILSDLSNPWKTLIQSTEHKYRKSMIEAMPWQSFIN